MFLILAASDVLGYMQLLFLYLYFVLCVVCVSIITATSCPFLLENVLAFYLNIALCGFDGVHILILLIKTPYRIIISALTVLNCPFLLR